MIFSPVDLMDIPGDLCHFILLNIDIILGVMPFVEELLRRGTKVRS